MAVPSQYMRGKPRLVNNSYILRGEIPPPCCWVESVGHRVATEHQSLKLVQKRENTSYQGTIPQAKANKWTNRKVMKLSLCKTIPKVAMECRTKVRGSMDYLMCSRQSTTITNPPGDFTLLKLAVIKE